MADKKYPKILYVREQSKPYPCHDLKYLEGTSHLESAIPDNNEETLVAVYQLLRIEKYKKVVTRTSVIEKVVY